MTFKVYIKAEGEEYKAVCARLGLEISHPDRNEASRRINQLIKATVEELDAKGLPLPPEPPKPVAVGSLGGRTGSSCRGKGCGSRAKKT